MATKPENIFRLGAGAGCYEERLIVPDEVDPHVLISRNDRPQPFYLIHEKDALLVQMSGRGRLMFADGGTRFFDLNPGDFVYIPGGRAHRFEPAEASVQLRYRAREPGLEAVAWRCAACNAEVARKVWQPGATPSPDAFRAACAWFNDAAAHRACPDCGEGHPPVDLSGMHWADQAASSAQPRDA